MYIYFLPPPSEYKRMASMFGMVYCMLDSQCCVMSVTREEWKRNAKVGLPDMPYCPRNLRCIHISNSNMLVPMNHSFAFHLLLYPTDHTAGLSDLIRYPHVVNFKLQHVDASGQWSIC